ncbi:MAG: hypothetical protein ACOYN0_03890 [Phycisphaerales bacterium]
MRFASTWRAGAIAISAGAAAVAPAQQAPPVHGGERLAPFWEACRTRRADVLCLGDSNQLHRAAGWDDAVSFVMSEEFGLYATGLHPLGENEGFGAGIGLGSTTLNTAGGPGCAYAGAPASAVARLDTEVSGLAPHNYLFVAEGSEVLGGVAAGMTLTAESPLTLAAALRFHVTFATFAGSGPGGFDPGVRVDTVPPQFLARPGVISTRGEDGVGRAAIDLPAGQRSGSVSLRLAADAQAKVIGPFVGYFARAERPGVERGVSVHTLYGKGGQSARDMALALQSASDQTLVMVLTEATSLQSGPRVAMVRICTGLNDRGEPLGSLGPEPQTPGGSAGAYADNLHAIVARLEQAWALAGFEPQNLYLVITPSHPVPGADDEPLKLYRRTAEDVARNHPRAASVDLARVVSVAELEKNSWYVTQGDYNHLRRDGARAVYRRELDSLLEASKP